MTSSGPSQPVCLQIKCKSKQNTPAYLKLSISASLFHKIIVSRKWCFPREDLDSVLAGAINIFFNSTPELSLTWEKHIYLSSLLLQPIPTYVEMGSTLFSVRWCTPSFFHVHVEEKLICSRISY